MLTGLLSYQYARILVRRRESQLQVFEFSLGGVAVAKIWLIYVSRKQRLMDEMKSKMMKGKVLQQIVSRHPEGNRAGYMSHSLVEQIKEGLAHGLADSL